MNLYFPMKIKAFDLVVEFSPSFDESFAKIICFPEKVQGGSRFFVLLFFHCIYNTVLSVDGTSASLKSELPDTSTKNSPKVLIKATRENSLAKRWHMETLKLFFMQGCAFIAEIYLDFLQCKKEMQFNLCQSIFISRLIIDQCNQQTMSILICEHLDCSESFILAKGFEFQINDFEDHTRAFDLCKRPMSAVLLKWLI